MNEITSTWLNFLQQQQLPSTPAPFDASQSFVAPLTDLGLIALTGEDAASFLHTQLTNDVQGLSVEQARLAGYCSPKGRLLATFLMWKTGDTILLQLPRNLQATLQKRLQMFVMRAKAKLADVSDGQVILGLAGNAVAATLAPWFPALPTKPYAKIDNSHGTLIRLADAESAPRYQWITSPDIAIAAWPQLTQNLPATDARRWRLTEILAGVPQITTLTQEQFVPQMINFEVIGGVNFKKGCYPGQEIVARSQYLGKLKRRAVLARVAAMDVAAATEVFSSADPGQPCGMIVNAEADSASHSVCLVEIKLAALEDGGSFHLGAADGPQLTVGTLPYVITDVTASEQPA
ncbi:aminomethyltransferase folate-binding domain protein [Collimonas arenae]|uniref:Aminomethyltransferase folate-binding domain protein n=1 Tax=Collimonas arenae TaxID=279058 RepID=A0A127PRT9_9BURK|nr:folate-binding protein YgfZ [Collimonas arenae]AMP00449.1 aminomethyltransferase folate-binding domain protein [Collimonas arenae]AMP10330.1 aminomethyltransferase folate-binding domain protein [Collimonas arenae]